MDDLQLKYDEDQFQRITQPLLIEHKWNLKDPSYQEVVKATSGVQSYIRDHPDEKTFIIYLMSGHGGCTGGKQAMVLNVFDERKSRRWYKLFVAEAFVRRIAARFANSWHLCLFCCCREDLDTSKHSGCF